MKAAVIGGGISGLASARRIAALGHDVTLFESESAIGGLGKAFSHGGADLERFYHCQLPTDFALIAHLRELGLDSKLHWRETRMGFLYQREIFPLNTPLDLLRFRPLGWIDRLRLGGLGLYARLRGTRDELDEITAVEWIRRIVGPRAFDIIWKPLLAAKIGDHYPALPALWISSRMHREKSTKLEQKGYLEGGLSALTAAFERDLRERGVDVRLDAPIRAIELAGEKMAVRTPDDRRVLFDYVVSTVPLTVFQKLASDLLAGSELAKLSLDYQGVVNAVFLTEKPLTSFYWAPWVDSSTTAQGVIEMSNLVPVEHSGGVHVNYLVNYVHRESELFARSDAELLDLYERDLACLYPDAAKTVVGRYLFRAPFVEPMWTTGYARQKPGASLIPGRLYLSCTAQLYPRVNSFNSCCEIVDEMMPLLDDETRARRVVA